MTLILRGGKIIDGTGAAPFLGDLVITEDRISAVGPSAETPPGATVVDATGHTVLPGLIDPHVHITWGETITNPRSWTAFSTLTTEQEAGFLDVTSKAARQFAEGAYIGRETLRAGFTTVRDVGVAAGYSDVVLREAVKNGFLGGPRILASGGGIAMTGGHGWDLGVVEADGVEAVRLAARTQLKAGADVIKIFATRAGLAGEVPGGPEFSIEEMKVICDEVRQRGKHTAAHAVGAEGIKRAVLAGVDTIEHGCYIDEEAAELMAERGTWLISTLHPYDRQATRATALGYPPYAAARSAEIMEVYPRNLRMAIDRGVKTALGSDSGIPGLTPHGENAREIVLFSRLLGVSPVEAIHRATGAAAESIRIGGTVGTLVPGKLADVLMVRADLETDIEAVLDLDNIRYVIKEGATVIANGEWKI
ncbi:metal-dependent hydrolase family protein [Oceanibacterium hippocampi]|uniref:Imidazolonepropionase n=1 Tax=Oceanibacterium hippocampi TaxID=745714 RepID=A0A1Y5TY34_9PROT|nr:amidohydrolase family protein [Oceanibacterium hippocampi]SLN75580.1 Imidazolonepropionase [Oceanibacterium hippocampi]